MRILVVSPSLPAPFRSTEGRWLHVLTKGLAARGHEVACVSCTEDRPDAVRDAEAAADENGFRLRHVPLFADEPLLARKLRSFALPMSGLQRSPGFLVALEEELALDPDVVHVEHLFHARSLLGLDQLVAYVHCLEIVDWRGRNDLTPRDRLDRHLMRRSIEHVVTRLDRTVVMTPRLEREVHAMNPLLATAVAPMGLDLSLYEPLGPVDEPVVGLIGSMSWYPSRSAAERILTRLWPAIRARIPDARLLVAGWDARRRLGRHFPLPGAELLDSVETPAAFFGRLGALLYPTAGGTGMKVKTLESMAYAIPVVTNADGIEGIEAEDGRDVALAESDEEFVEATVGLLSDAARRKAIGRSGRELVERAYSADAAVDGLLRAYEAVFDRTPTPA